MRLPREIVNEEYKHAVNDLPRCARSVEARDSAVLAQNGNKVKPGEFIIDHPTLINLGFEWLIQGDDNRNAQVEVSYRKQGQPQWKQGLPLLRLQGERIYQNPFHAWRRGSALRPRACAWAVIWAMWHLPLFFIPGVDNYRQSFTLFLIAVTALSVAMAWLYMHTSGSLLLVMLMHSAVNQTPFLMPSANPTTTNPFVLSASLVGWLTAAFLWIGAAYLLARMRRIDVSWSATQPATGSSLTSGRPS